VKAGRQALQFTMALHACNAYVAESAQKATNQPRYVMTRQQVVGAAQPTGTHAKSFTRRHMDSGGENSVPCHRGV